MDVQVEETGTLTRKITVTLPAEDVQGKLDAAYDKLKKDVKLKGFRRGKVPRAVIVKHYKQQVEGEVGEKLVQDTYFDVVEKEKVDPIVHPEITSVRYNEDGTYTYVAEVDVRPEFSLNVYKGLEVEKEPIVVNDEDIDRELVEMRRNMAALRSVTDRPVQQDDVVTVDFQGYHNGEAMPSVHNDNYSVDVGSGRMGAEFEERLVGMQLNEEGSHEVDFPANHPNPILKGKKIEFRTVVRDIKERVLVEFDDEFAKDVGEEFTTLAELKDSIRARLKGQQEERAAGAVTDRIMQKLLDNHDFPVPKRLVAYEIEQMVKQTVEQLEQSGLSLEAAGISREKLAQDKEPIAEKRVRGDFILKKIGEVEEIKVEEEDMERGFQRIATMYNMPVAKVKEHFRKREDILPFVNELLNEKILTFLREQTVFIEPAPVADDGEAGSES